MVKFKTGRGSMYGNKADTNPLAVEERLNRIEKKLIKESDKQSKRKSRKRRKIEKKQAEFIAMNADNPIFNQIRSGKPRTKH